MTVSTTLATAIDDVKEMRAVYGPEELRVESNFIALLIPTSISLLPTAMEPQVSAPLRNGFLLFLIAYLAAVLCDLVRVSLLNSSAKQLQHRLDAARQPNTPSTEISLPEELRGHYQKLKKGSPKRKYIHPLLKISFAICAFLVGFLASGG